MKSYIQILEDTLLAFTLNAYTKTKKRKAISRSKFYFFDIGVVNFLSNRSLIKNKNREFGEVFEQFLILEVRAYLSYFRKKKNVLLALTSKLEVDLLVDSTLAIEIKASDQIQEKHLKGLRALKEEGIFQRYIVISNDLNKRITKDGIEIFPWKEFLKELWENHTLL